MVVRAQETSKVLVPVFLFSCSVHFYHAQKAPVEMINLSVTFWITNRGARFLYLNQPAKLPENRTFIISALIGVHAEGSTEPTNYYI